MTSFVPMHDWPRLSAVVLPVLARVEYSQPHGKRFTTDTPPETISV